MRLNLNPITKRRLGRFRQIKRAYWSFWALLILYVIGLMANLLCNNLPLFLRYEGKVYLPILFYYPEDTFLKNGRLTRPDYKQLAQDPNFGKNPGNVVIFSPFPYGPNESVSKDSIDFTEGVTVRFERNQRVATVNIRTDYSISRSRGSAYFFAVDRDRSVRDLSVRERFRIPEKIEEAVSGRFQNRFMPSLSSDTENSEGVRVTISLSQYEPRVGPPKSVRLTLREIVQAEASEEIEFDSELRPKTKPPPLWENLAEMQREALLEKVKDRFDQAVAFETIVIGDRQFRVNFEKEDFYFPYRPTKSHIMGLDSSGRDVLVRIIYALRTSLNFGFLLVCSTMVIGILFGALQGYYGGKTDLAGQRLIEIWESLPFIYILILIGSVYGRSFVILLFLYGLFNWIGISYYMRAEFLRLRKQPFVESAHCMGLSTFKVVFKHILPNGLVPIITFFPFSLVGAIGVLAALDYLGFGLPPPTPSWGELLSQAQEFRYAWWLVLYPSTALFVVVLFGVFIGEGVRSAFDPRTNSKIE